MNRTKSFVLLTIVLTLIICGAVFLSKVNEEKNKNQITENRTNQKVLTDEEIAKAVGQTVGGKNFSFVLEKNPITGFFEHIDQYGYTDVTVQIIARGDLNNDGNEDAVTQSHVCGATCGVMFTVILLGDSGVPDTFSVSPEGIILSSAVQSRIKNISIDDGVITIDYTDYSSGSDNYIERVDRYKLSDKIFQKQF